MGAVDPQRRRGSAGLWGRAVAVPAVLDMQPCLLLRGIFGCVLSIIELH